MKCDECDYGPYSNMSDICDGCLGDTGDGWASDKNEEKKRHWRAINNRDVDYPSHDGEIPEGWFDES